MNRRGFLTRTGATAIGAAAAANTDSVDAALASDSQSQTKPTKRKIFTERAPKPVGPYSQAIVAGNMIFVAGQGPIDPRTGKIVIGTFEEQAVLTFENIKAILEAAGATLADVVKVNVYLADLGDFPKLNEIYTRYFSGDYPARATVGAQLLFHTFIEVDCIAVKSES
jgi:2-iminobutanoate/2-iminopropanoate deaminase